MSGRRAWVGAMVVAGAMVMAACSSSPSSSAASSGPPVSTPPSTSPSATTTGPGANPGSDFCTGLKTEKTDMSKLGSTLGAAIASNDFTTTKTTLAAFFASTGQGLAQVESTMADAPANVLAALTVVNQYFTQLQSVIANSTSMKQLETGMESQANNAQLKAAGQTLDAYTKAQCGDITSPSP